MNIHQSIVQCILINDLYGLSHLLDTNPGIDLECSSEYGITYAHMAANLTRAAIVNELELRGASMQTLNTNGHNVRSALNLKLIENENSAYENELQALVDTEILTMMTMESIKNPKD